MIRLLLLTWFSAEAFQTTFLPSSSRLPVRSLFSDFARLGDEAYTLPTGSSSSSTSTSLETSFYPERQGFVSEENSLICDLADCIVVSADSSVQTKEIDESSASQSIIDQILSSYLGPRLLLAAIACLYGTNFPLGSLMDHAMPASAATSARFVLASLALSPFIFQIRKELIGVSVFAGCLTSMGYIAQSLALVDTSPATVSFLGAATVIWCPFLEWLVDKKPMGINERPQTWLAGTLCMTGVGILELCGGGSVDVSSHTGIGMGDGLALLQAVGFGTGLFLSEKMMKQHAEQALPVTAVMVAMTAFISMIWALTDGWMWNMPGWESMTLPNLLFDPSMGEVAVAVVWTGLLSTSLNFYLETVSLQKVPSGEASVILASEPLWAAAFAAIMLGESFGWNDYVGGVLIVSACLVNCLSTSKFQELIPFPDNKQDER